MLRYMVQYMQAFILVTTQYDLRVTHTSVCDGLILSKAYLTLKLWRITCIRKIRNATCYSIFDYSLGIIILLIIK